MPTILVVADQADIRQRLCLIYLQGGFVVREAKDSPTAFALAQLDPIHAVILNLQPEITALKACSRFVHEHKIPVIYVTTDTNIDAALDAGASNIVTNLHPRLLLHCTQVLLEAQQSTSQRQLAEALRDTAAMLNSSLGITSWIRVKIRSKTVSISSELLSIAAVSRSASAN